MGSSNLQSKMPSTPTLSLSLGKFCETCPKMMILEFWPRRSPHPVEKKGNTLKQERKLVVNKHRTKKHKQDKKI